MGRNALKASIALRSLVRHGRTEMYFEIPPYLSANRVNNLNETEHSNQYLALLECFDFEFYVTSFLRI